MTDSPDSIGIDHATAHDVLGVVRFRHERLAVYERRCNRSCRISAVGLGVIAVMNLAILALVPAVGLIAVPFALLMLLLTAPVPLYSYAAARRIRAGLPRRDGPDVAVVVRRSGLDVAWSDLGPARPVSLTWGDLTNVGQRGPMRGVMVLRIRTRRRPAGSWFRLVYLPQDLLDTPVDLVVRDVQALTGGAVRT
ncbi:hypothetical protein [Mumia quercus]|uniref:hypothetical protein n=1 Tax=Mumia quercus TaxID=2976125 RepID=UPI0021D1D784|nr:hypothetical protein [Mumia quercus]